MNRVIAVQDAGGHLVRMTYDSVGNLLEQSEENSTNVLDGNSDIVSGTLTLVNKYAYDELNRRTASCGPLGDIAITEYDDLGNVITQRSQNETQVLEFGEITEDTLDPVTQYAYDKLGRNVAVLDASNRIVKRDYDTLGNLLAQTQANDTHVYAGGQVQDGELIQTTKYAYDKDGRATATEDAAGHVRETVYDSLGNVIEVQEVNTTNILGAGNTVVEDQAVLLASRWAYDVMNRKTASEDAYGHIVHSTYDTMGNAIEVSTTNETTVLQNGALVTATVTETVKSVYDAMNQQVAVQDAGGHLTTTDYDSVGNVMATHDALTIRPPSHTTP